MSKYKTSKGRPSPLGATLRDHGVNFALFSAHAHEVIVALFHPGEQESFLEVTLNREGDVWHLFIENLPSPCEYAYRVEGGASSFNPKLFLLDPYAKRTNSPHRWGAREIPYRPRGIIPSPSDSFNWEGDTLLKIPLENLIIYEMHVRAFTKDASSHVKEKGTFLGVIERIPYLKELGINAVELMPIFEFNECEYSILDPVKKTPLCNFWGYSTVNFFSPMNRYAHSDTVNEFKTLVKELHKNGIEVILDVVYNHTSEGMLHAPVTSFRGIDNATYYMLNADGHYMDFTGTGNTVNCNNPPVSKMILDSLRYWVEEMHVDGFRFDLASIFSRDSKGIPLGDPPILKAMRDDPILSQVRLISESWDAAGLYQVGHFPSWGPWSEWNGKYRDTVRQFIKGTDGVAGAFAGVLCGSQNLYNPYDSPLHSINFITAHDGFTLQDLVSYQNKHNLQNGEENRDGTNDNESWNCGAEGVTKKQQTYILRERQVRNFQLALFTSLGVPMLLMGDEQLHTRKGNNNAWCQDNTLNWLQWDKPAPEFFRFIKLLIRLREKSALFRQKKFLTHEDVSWHGHLPFEPEWTWESRFVAYTIKNTEEAFYIAFNSHFEFAEITLPEAPGGKKWLRVVDTSLHSPQDFLENPQEGPPLTSYSLPAHSALLLQAHT